ncbi:MULTISPECIES: hypothetical protein [unclassified Cyanobium]|uniref:hypothetical protein n=1 Tax=unclassified Cyanobium TaxID=2627006 RepID=UPI0020CE5B6F|nr:MULTISPECIES: hypothetical protein [unclassified Cyanobium]MCP9834902.1 hypothetical protein [Cyanobium sp. La Preciosa 7G6]MCP9937665.1 hypothetical protein [Cyanobium sp. Aljojuca 7A6]
MTRPGTDQGLVQIGGRLVQPVSGTVHHAIVKGCTADRLRTPPATAAPAPAERQATGGLQRIRRAQAVLPAKVGGHQLGQRLLDAMDPRLAALQHINQGTVLKPAGAIRSCPPGQIPDLYSLYRTPDPSAGPPPP